MSDDVIIRQFEALEQKIEKLLAVCRSLETTNSELKNKIEALEGDLQGRVAAESNYIKEKDQIRSKIDALLAKLETVSDS